MHGAWLASQGDPPGVMHAQRCDAGGVSSDVRHVLLEPRALARFDQRNIQHAIGAVGMRGEWRFGPAAPKLRISISRYWPDSWRSSNSISQRHGRGSLQHAFEYVKSCGQSGVAAIHLVDIPGPTRVDFGDQVCEKTHAHAFEEPMRSPRPAGDAEIERSQRRTRPSVDQSFEWNSTQPKVSRDVVCGSGRQNGDGNVPGGGSPRHFANSAVPARNDEEIRIVVECRVPERVRPVIRRRGDPRAQAGR